MRVARLAALFAVALLVGTAHAATADPGAPTGLHAFLLRADEPGATTYHRTPSFAWNPVAGAKVYQFQISTSSTFRDNGIVYNANNLLTPVAAPPIILPWITGSPHSLYARVRATVAGTAGPIVTDWSTAFGFDVVPPPPPAPLPADPGLLRWTPIEGADSYQVWLIDVVNKNVPKKETVRTNVLDEREFYTFHPSLAWISSVRWRVRAVRSNASGGPQNGLPAVTYGAWSPIYNSSNSSVPPGGPITLVHTISDVTSDGSNGSSAHRLMPAFVWRGNQSLNGTPAELFRVYVFTDSQCVNLVYTSAVVGSPAYAPRPGGPLAMPADAGGVANARSSFLNDGQEANDLMYDGTPVTPQEQFAPSAPTTAPPLDPVAGGTATAPSSGSGASSGSSGGSGSSGSAGAPVDLWDTDWPQSGYYWTVIPVSETTSSGGSSTVAAPGASFGSTLVPVNDATQFSVGESITIGTAPISDTVTISKIGSGLITVSGSLAFGHPPGDPVVPTSPGSVIYKDLDLPQDACFAGRKQRFGIASEPSLTTSNAPFVTGLSSTGQLISATTSPLFYGQPLVAWTPALGAQNYEVQWSKQTKAYPFVAQGTIMTTSTSAVLPIANSPGTYYYRVRGFDYNLPTGVQQMSWSDPQRLDVAKPKFKILPPKKNTFKIKNGK